MPKGVCCGEKAVLVTVYVERPVTIRRKVAISGAQYNNRQHQHHIKRTAQAQHHHKRNGSNSHHRGHNRKADLLHYSHGLRESARSEASTPSHSTDSIAYPTEQPINKTVSVGGKHKHSKVPNCLGNWKALIPRFLRGSHGKKQKKKNQKHYRTTTTATKMKAIMSSLEERAQKKLDFVKKLVSTFTKKR